MNKKSISILLAALFAAVYLAGYGGANLSIEIALSEGKAHIHSGGQGKSTFINIS